MRSSTVLSLPLQLVFLVSIFCFLLDKERCDLPLDFDKLGR
jgi:hypothetical protein